MQKIRILPRNLVNQIAAGEIIERPASIIKEVVENAIDAKAKNITISLENGGKTFIAIKDDGHGMSKEDMELCLHPHTTSKLLDDNLSNINTLGFRGEALSSIVSVSKILISSKEQDSDMGYEIYGQNGEIHPLKPSNIDKGTTIKVTDLFFSVPARLKFLRSDQVEASHCYAIIKRLALQNPYVSFRVESAGKLLYNYGASKEEDYFAVLKHRISQVLEDNFLENAILVNERNSNYNFYGFIGVPTFSKNNTNNQFFIVNNRSLKDKFLSSIVKVAYGDTLVSGRNPVYVLFLEVDAKEVDVNVNPTKTEVRFKDVAFIRHLLLSALKNSLLNNQEMQNSTEISEKLFNTVKAKAFGSQSFNNLQNSNKNSSNYSQYNNKDYDYDGLKKENTYSIIAEKETSAYVDELKLNNYKKNYVENYEDLTINNTHKPVEEVFVNLEKQNVLGFAKAQFHKNWIVAQNHEGLIVIDQHAAHERITHEELKEQWQNNNILTQILLISEIIELDAEDMLIIEEYKNSISKLGIIFDVFGSNVILVKEVPAILGNINVKILMKDLIEDLKNLESSESFDKKINNIIAKIACHGSVRAGKELSIEEMNALLRKMEKTKNYGQCSHGRPTFIKITLKDLEKFFGRT